MASRSQLYTNLAIYTLIPFGDGAHIQAARSSIGDSSATSACANGSYDANNEHSITTIVSITIIVI
jgi:hypothetical protein